MKKFNIPLFISITVLSLFGLLMVYSSSYIWAEYKYNDPYKYLKSQGLFLILGIITMLIVSKIDYKKYYKYSSKIFSVCFILIILVLFIGTERNGSKSWFGIGSFGIQPSEFMKLAMIIFTSKYLYNNKKECIGFLMQKAQGFPIDRILSGGKMREQYGYGNVTMPHLLKICRNFLILLNYLHSKRVLVGDINPHNIMINTQCEVFLIDCDSYQVGNTQDIERTT